MVSPATEGEYRKIEEITQDTVLHRCLLDANELTRYAMISKTKCVGCRTSSSDALHGTTLNTFTVLSGAGILKVG